jgi:hypothetical protein
MALFGRDYDNDYGRDFNRGGMQGSRGGYAGGGYAGGGYSGGGYSGGGAWGQGYRGAQRGGSDSWTGSDRSFRGGAAGGYGSNRYDRTYSARGGSRYGNEYDRNYKSQWQTDHGDPFGDRSSNTPMRVIHGEYQSRSNRDRNDRGGWFGRDRNRYEADYSANPMGYDPYRSRESSMERGWGMRDFDRGSRYGRDFRDDRY